MKSYNKRTFKINRNIWVDCETQDTRYGFRHLAELVVKYEHLDTAKACYYNRTWESFCYESVLERLFETVKQSGSLTKYQLAQFKAVIKNGGEVERKRVGQELKTVGLVASLGQFFSSNQKESNDWKARMIKAGLGDKGLIMPEDWESLTEDEKTKRLDAVIKNLLGK